jgi:hypothetical protein
MFFAMDSALLLSFSRSLMQKHFNAFPSLFQEIIVLFESDKVEITKARENPGPSCYDYAY